MKVKVENLCLTYPIISGDSFLARKNFIDKILNIFKKKNNKLKFSDNITERKKNYKITALKNINFELQAGDRLGLVGFNGSGKSTLLKCLSGILEADCGSKIHIEGSYLPIINPINFSETEDTVLNNLILISMILGFKIEYVRDNIVSILNFSELQEYKNYPFSTLSTGMRFRLIFAICFVLERDIYFIDEFLTTGDEKFQNKGFDFINNQKKSPIIILCSHSQDTIKKFCNKILLLEKGKQIFIGDVNEGLKIFQTSIDNL
jgi:ABC-type polysaccharide/polyol phosphate transport system ATPase subunit